MQKKWYQRNWLIIVLLVFFPPASAGLVWTTQWKRWAKIAVSIWGVLFIGASMLTNSSETELTDTQEARDEVVTGEETTAIGLDEETPAQELSEAQQEGLEPKAEPEAKQTLEPQQSIEVTTSQETPADLPETSVDSSNRPEDLLAQIDGNPNEADVYEKLLDSAELKCDESRIQLADMTVKSVEIARDEGKATSNLDMLNGLNNAVESLESETECSQILAAILLMM
jgi:hypothetical protein